MSLTLPRVFVGYDARERHGFHVFVQSLLDHAEMPIAIIPLSGEQRDGSNTFTYARFLVPYYCGFKGRAIFLDGSDMLARRDILELWASFDGASAVQVVKHDYRTQHPRKYLGTTMEASNVDYPRKNWSSVVLWNCEHPANAVLTPDVVSTSGGPYLHRFQWLKDAQVGTLTARWNHLVGESGTNDRAAIAHFTLGIPHIPAYSNCEFANEYHATAQAINAPIPATEKVCAEAQALIS